MHKNFAYPGRLVFDHLPKTAGQAINAWLVGEIGSGCVTENLIGNHLDLIRIYGGDYSVISAHVSFFGEGLDPRYQYITCLREPLDRALSWIYFVANQRAEDFLGKHGQENYWHEANAFIESNGIELGAQFRDSLINPYVRHFSSIRCAAQMSDAEQIQSAKDAIELYDVWGLYEKMPNFMAEVATLIGLPTPLTLARKNVTATRTPVEAISADFRRRLEEILQLDIEFYGWLRQVFANKAVNRNNRGLIKPAHWIPFERTAHLQDKRVSRDFSLISIDQGHGSFVIQGQILQFNLNFSINREVWDLIIGIHLFDSFGQRVFGTNNKLLDKPLQFLKAGTHQVCYSLVADMPGGDYTAGFSFAEYYAEGTKELAWYDSLVNFHVEVSRCKSSIGSMRLPVSLDCWQLNERIASVVLDTSGCIELVDDCLSETLGDLEIGEVIQYNVLLSNNSGQDWVSLWQKPINLSYHWLDDKGLTVVVDGLRSPLPDGGLCIGNSVVVKIAVAAPQFPGRYILQLVPVQENVCWFNDRGFTPLGLEVNVVNADMARRYPARDMRLHTQVGRPQGASLIGGHESGFLIYGPYTKLPPGAWHVMLFGRFDPCHTLIWADVAAFGGTHCFVKVDVERSMETLDLYFNLEVEVGDLEFRLWVSEGAKVRLDWLVIEPDKELCTSKNHILGLQQ